MGTMIAQGMAYAKGVLEGREGVSGEELIIVANDWVAGYEACQEHYNDFYDWYMWYYTTDDKPDIKSAYKIYLTEHKK